MLQIPVSLLTPKKSILRGSTLGQLHSEDLYNRLKATVDSSQILILDFSGIEAVTASYLKQLLSPVLRNPPVGGIWEEIFPLVTNLCGDAREDLRSFLSENGWLMSEIQEKGGLVVFTELLGSPEPAMLQTFDMLKKCQPASAMMLFESSGDKGITQTAWNNRLSNLLRLKLVTRIKKGREWLYQTTFNQ